MIKCIKCGQIVEGNIDPKAEVICWLCVATGLGKHSKKAEESNKKCQKKIAEKRLKKLNNRRKE